MKNNKEQTLNARARWWSYRRQRLGKAALSLEEALHDVVGVYSSHPSAPLSLWARSVNFSAEAFRKLEQDRQAIRIPAMRSSIFLMLCNDAIDAFAAKSAASLSPLRWIRYTNIYNKTSYATITIETYNSIKKTLLAAATEPLSPNQIHEALGKKERGTLSLAQAMANEGELLRIGSQSLRANALRYVSAAAWGVSLRSERDAEEALRRLAKRYLTAFGPARVEDFQWWLGINNTQAVAALASLDTVTLADGSLLLAEDVAGFEKVLPLPSDLITILPKWDSYTMGYAPDGRARFVDPKHQARIYNGNNGGGDGLGTILVAGQAIAAWHITFSGNRHTITIDLFDRSAEQHLPAIHEHFEEITTILGGSVCSIHDLDPTGPSLASTLRPGHLNKKTVA